ALETTLSSYKSKIETLQKRVDSLEGLRRSEHDQLTKQVRVSQAIRSRVDEASHLAVDLDHSLDSIEASIATLRDRSRRLKSSLELGEAETVTSPAPLSTSFVPPEEPEAEPVRPALSQADWGTPAAAPEPVAEPEPAPVEEEALAEEAPEEPVELPSFSEVTRTKIKPAPRREPDPDPAAEPAVLEKRPDIQPELELLPDETQGRVKEPTGVLPIIDAQPAAEAAGDESSDIPLISPPE